LERAGLVRVEHSPGRCLIVELLDAPATVMDPGRRKR
jgi:hypothetical protein